MNKNEYKIEINLREGCFWVFFLLMFAMLVATALVVTTKGAGSAGLYQSYLPAVVGDGVPDDDPMPVPEPVPFQGVQIYPGGGQYAAEVQAAGWDVVRYNPGDWHDTCGLYCEWIDAGRSFSSPAFALVDADLQAMTNIDIAIDVVLDANEPNICLPLSPGSFTSYEEFLAGLLRHWANNNIVVNYLEVGNAIEYGEGIGAPGAWGCQGDVANYPQLLERVQAVASQQQVFFSFAGIDPEWWDGMLISVLSAGVEPAFVGVWHKCAFPIVPEGCSWALDVKISRVRRFTELPVVTVFTYYEFDGVCDAFDPYTNQEFRPTQYEATSDVFAREDLAGAFLYVYDETNPRCSNMIGYYP